MVALIWRHEQRIPWGHLNARPNFPGGRHGRHWHADPLLRAAGYDGAPQRRSLRGLEAAGATPVVVDVFDSAALRTTLARIRPRHVMHQLTDLALLGDPPAPASRAANARIRDEGTRNLVAAALAAGSETLVAQSIDWIYAPQAPPCDEAQALDLDAQGTGASA